MNLILAIAGALLAGYFVPVLLSLGFALAVGSYAPDFADHGGAVSTRFLTASALVWTLAVLAGAYLAAMIAGPFAWPACAAAAVLLLVVLLLNHAQIEPSRKIPYLALMAIGTLAATAAGTALRVHGV